VSGTTLKKPPRGAAAARVGVLAASPFQGGRPEGGAWQGKEGLRRLAAAQATAVGAQVEAGEHRPALPGAGEGGVTRGGLGEDQVHAQGGHLLALQQLVAQGGQAFAGPGPVPQGLQAGLVQIDDGDVGVGCDRLAAQLLAPVLGDLLQPGQQGQRGQQGVPEAQSGQAQARPERSAGPRQGHRALSPG
jgi:hypothetical protein